MEVEDPRFIRQQEIIPLKAIQELTVLVAGVGAVGRQVALQLAAMGIGTGGEGGRLILVDPDIVERHNCATQGYTQGDENKNKSIVTTVDCRGIHGVGERGIQYYSYGEGVKAEDIDYGDEKVDIVFVCVDNMEARGRIWRRIIKTGKEIKLVIDTRMDSEVIRILTVPLDDSDDMDAMVVVDRYVREALFADEKATEGRCTARMTIYSAAVNAGLAVAQFAKWLRRDKGIPLQKDISFNLLTMELSDLYGNGGSR